MITYNKPPIFSGFGLTGAFSAGQSLVGPALVGPGFTGPGLTPRPIFDGPTLTPLVPSVTALTGLAAAGPIAMRPVTFNASWGLDVVPFPSVTAALTGHAAVSPSAFAPGHFAPGPTVYAWMPDTGPDYDYAAASASAQELQIFELLYLPVEHLRRRLVKLIQQRINKSVPPPELKTLRSPVGIFFMRDRKTAGANDIRDEIVNGFEYWSADSGEHFDMFFPGWYMRNKKLHFNSKRFLEYRLEIEKHSKWQYSGETDILILDFDYDLKTEEAFFDFKHAIHLKVEELIREKKTGSVSTLLSLIQNTAKESGKYRKNSAVWQISDKIGYHKGGKSFWRAIRKTFLREFSNVYDELEPFAVVDLSLDF